MQERSCVGWLVGSFYPIRHLEYANPCTIFVTAAMKRMTFGTGLRLPAITHMLGKGFGVPVLGTRAAQHWTGTMDFLMNVERRILPAFLLAGLSMTPAAERAGLRAAYRPADVERARANLARHQWAREVKDSVLSTCKQYYDLPPSRLAALVPEKTPLVSGRCPKCDAHFASAEILDHGDVLRCVGCKHTWRCEEPDRSETWDVYGAMRSFRLRYLYLRLDSLGLAHQLTGDAIYAQRGAAVVKKFARVPALPHEHDPQESVARSARSVLRTHRRMEVPRRALCVEDAADVRPRAG